MPIEEPRRLARLDPSGVHVLCGSALDGRYLCNREFGPVLELPTPRSVQDHRQHLVLDPPGQARDHLPIRVFRFPPGWARRAGGVWDLHAPQTVERTHEQYDEILRWWGRVTRLPSGLLEIIGAARPPDLPELPARAVCQRCRTISELRPEELRVVTELPHVRLAPGVGSG
jgi:hypothetical protein